MNPRTRNRFMYGMGQATVLVVYVTIWTLCAIVVFATWRVLL